MQQHDQTLSWEQVSECQDCAELSALTFSLHDVKLFPLAYR